jgi:hypothetical protein
VHQNNPGINDYLAQKRNSHNPSPQRKKIPPMHEIASRKSRTKTLCFFPEKTAPQTHGASSILQQHGASPILQKESIH